ncbi:hypothetical protein GCM10029964_068580 [Kibdelosporangium lantanae]
MVRHLISLDDVPDADLRDIVDRAVGFANRAQAKPLTGKVVGVYFRKTSTRTRTAFSSGALRLGAGIVAYGPDDLQLNTGESSVDTGRVMSGMLDALVARTAGDSAEMRAWAQQSRMAVVNAMSTEEHPTQALADLTTLVSHFGSIDGMRVLYLGEGNNTAAALALGLSRFRGTQLDLRTPPVSGSPRRSTHGPRRTRPPTAPRSMSGTTSPTCPGTSTWCTPPGGRRPGPASRARTGGTCSRRSRSPRTWWTRAARRSSCTTSRPTGARR